MKNVDTKLFNKLNNHKTSESEKNNILELVGEENLSTFSKQLITEMFENGNEEHNISNVFWKKRKNKEKLTYNEDDEEEFDIELRYNDKKKID